MKVIVEYPIVGEDGEVFLGKKEFDALSYDDAWTQVEKRMSQSEFRHAKWSISE